MPSSPPTFERSILWVAHPKLLWQRVGGLSVLERQLFTIARAGLKSCFVASPRPDAGVLSSLRLPASLEITWVDAGTGASGCEPPYLGVSSDHFLRADTLAHVARQSYPESIAYEDAAGLGVVQVVLRREDTISRRKLPLPDGSYKRLEAPLSQGPIVDWLMVSGPKPQDGFMARHFDRHLSLAVSRSLLNTTVTPNQMTVFSTCIGLAGASFFLGDTRLAYVAGALLVWLHSVLDGCDGELARVRFQESAFGSDLDFWGDNLVHLALFTCLGVGFWRDGHEHTILLAAIADAAVIASAWTAWAHRRARRAAGAQGPEAGVVDETAGDGLETKLSRLENSLAQRDFIYLLVVLAFVDMVYEFLWAAAIGGVLYFAIMLYLRRVNHNEQARQPHPAR
ncbi:MAG: CDP-alcohol phosphatidyltransferase family protein [Elusimicrobiota bacterium]|nr:MAG: CDP-alcohol phosphatidyltransferase family protein [Elusimicrobiota bacterium]